MSGSLRIVFMGTPEFAVASLAALHSSAHEIAAVVTVADKPAGRGQEVAISEVKKYALEHDLPILQPEKLREDSFVAALQSLNSDLFVVVAFRMLPEIIWSMPRLGTINLHGSLLPNYRGAAPINHAIINGELETGVTIFFLQAEIDTGKILKREVIPIAKNESAGELHDRMMSIGARALVQVVDDLAAGKTAAKSQEELMVSGEILKTAPKIYKENCKIDWNQSAANVHNFIRGLSPYPAAWTMLGGKTLKIFFGEKSYQIVENDEVFITDNKTFLKFRCLDGYYLVKSLQLEGKRKMDIETFLQGWRHTI